MILKSIKLTDFKNHEDSHFEFNERINCVLGNNGRGKTNLLDAIYFLSFSKSALSNVDKNAIRFARDSFTIFGKYNSRQIGLQVAKQGGKIIKIDGKQTRKVSELIGKIPLVMMLPDDTSMIKEGSDERRKFFDAAICQFDTSYLSDLIKYNRLLKQRNSLLKEWAKNAIDLALLDTYDDKLIDLARRISAKRSLVVGHFLPYLKENYASLHATKELPDLQFVTHVDDDFGTTFKNSLPKDQIMQRTMMGSHRDDFLFLLNQEPIKGFGSQGQQKTFIIALKFALFDFLKENTKTTPLLLLDDIFDKLDDSRISLLVDCLKDQDRFGQIFLSDARSERSKHLFKSHEHVSFYEL
ncbi:MAG: DNA replication and repair protein RecF [Bacteroidota bacterium]